MVLNLCVAGNGHGNGCDCIAGNHDWAAIERISIDFFNAYAKAAAIWTREQLTPEHKEWLSNSP